MKYQNLFSGKNKKNIKMLSAECFTQHAEPLDIHIMKEYLLDTREIYSVSLSKEKGFNPYPAVHDNPYLCKQCRSRSDGRTVCHSDGRSHLIRI